MSSILHFTNQYDFLSNFFPRAIVLDGHEFASAEHAFQAHKASSVNDFQWIMAARTPAEAKQRGRKVLLRADWEVRKMEVMLDVLRAKFKDPDLARRLLKTFPDRLVEGNWWGDRFWGVDSSGQGENWLGVLLMHVRDELSTGIEMPFTLPNGVEI